MVTSGAQSKAIHDWLIPSVEVSSRQILSGDVDGMPPLRGSHQPFGVMGEVGSESEFLGIESTWRPVGL